MFLFLWMPTIAIMYIFRGMASPWWTWGLGLFSHTQGLVSALVTMGKQDVRQAVWDFVVCSSYRANFKSNQHITDGTVEPSKSTLVDCPGVELATLRNEKHEKEVEDDIGLPIQGSNFEFLDEASSHQSLASIVDDGQND
jgi:hypothetical protein